MVLVVLEGGEALGLGRSVGWVGRTGLEMVCGGVFIFIFRGGGCLF